MSNSIIINLILFIIVILSIILHEIGHSYMSYRFGDFTQKYSGRLSLNPFKHLSLIGTFIFPALLVLFNSPVVFGWANPVKINPDLYTNKSKGIFWVSIAGILMNLIVVLLGLIMLKIINYDSIAQLIYFAILINIILAVFNLMPCPPLDGFKILTSFLYNRNKHLLLMIDKYGKFLLIIMIILLYRFNFLGIIIRNINKLIELWINTELL